jgi:hypothetical protein
MAPDVTPTEQRFVAGFGQLLSQADVDARGGIPRKVRALVRSLANDLGSDLPLAQRMLVQRTAMIEVLCEHCETAILLGQRQDIALADYISLTATQARILKMLGLRRVPKDVTPDPLEYARSVGAADDQDAVP